MRNTKVIDIVHELKEYNIDVDVYDPWVNAEEARHEYSISPISNIANLADNSYDGIILAVAHNQFVEMGVKKIRELGKQNHVLYDLKYLFDSDLSDLRL